MLSWILTHVALILGFLLAVLVIAHMLRQKRSPSGTIAWLLVIVLLPYVGVPLYLALGGRKMKRRAESKRDLELLAGEGRLVSECSSIDRLLRTFGIPGATAGNRLALCQDGEDAYARLVDLIESASRSIHVAMFILHPDEVGTDILQRLARKAGQGLEVRLLLDGVGSLHTTRRFLAPLTDAGGRVEFFIPVLHRPWRGRTNLRNHRKIVLADGCRAMAGGTNIAGEYIGPVPKPGRWRDLSFVLEGPAAGYYSEVFRLDWEFAGRERLEPLAELPGPIGGDGDGSVVQVVPSGPDVPGDPLYSAILSSAFAATERLWIVTPYFVPDDALAQALALAAHRGIDLRIHVPETSNHRMADYARGPYLREIQAAGGEIQLYTKGMVHAKIVLMDDVVAMIGSANLDMRSLFLDYEVMSLAYSRQDIRAVEDWIRRLETDSRIGVDDVGALRDLWEGVVRMVAPLL
ncbi:MAG: cardiolipin synthase [Phycisphaerae bacterium]|nr:cardiolipin synthase [Phycisphaerae bacterium]